MMSFDGYCIFTDQPQNFQKENEKRNENGFGVATDYESKDVAESDRGLRMGRVKPEAKPKPKASGKRWQRINPAYVGQGFVVAAESDRGLRMGREKPKANGKTGYGFFQKENENRNEDGFGVATDYG